MGEWNAYPQPMESASFRYPRHLHLWEPQEAMQGLFLIGTECSESRKSLGSAPPWKELTDQRSHSLLSCSLILLRVKLNSKKLSLMTYLLYLLFQNWRGLCMPKSISFFPSYLSWLKREYCLSSQALPCLLTSAIFTWASEISVHLLAEFPNVWGWCISFSRIRPHICIRILSDEP